MASSTWNIDSAHSSAEFKVKHMMISNVKGKFAGIGGKLIYDAADVAAASVQADIPVSTVSTGDAQRDNHLKSTDFFDVEKFPTFVFKSTSVKPLGPGE